MNKKKLNINKQLTVGIIAPSSTVPNGLIQSTVAYLKENGVNVKLGKYLGHSELFAAGTDEQRAEDITTFYNDPEVSVILTTNGGACSIRTLPLLDYDIINKNPKPIIGYSDATALQLGIYTKTGMTSFTGFNCSDIKNNQVNQIILTTLTHCLNKEAYSVNGGIPVNKGKATGPLIGGNLTCLLNLMGTPYQPDFKNKILLIEDVGIEPYLVEGMCSQLYVSGVLNQIAGLVIGIFTECDARHFSSQVTTEQVLNFWCKKIDVPCVRNFPYGHIADRFVLPIGQIVTLDATNCKIDVHFDEQLARSGF